MSKKENFISELEKSIRSQFKSRNVGYLLGAGASYLNGSGYPLALTIWDRINNSILQPERNEIQAKLDMDGTEGLEHALDLLENCWFSSNNIPLRVSLNSKEEDTWRRLMIPPQYRKATETTTQPYSALWTRFRAWLVHGPRPLNRLVCIGYGMRDQHVNDVIESATSRNDFTLLIFAKKLTDECFKSWAGRENVIIVTADCCSLFGQEGPGHDRLWDFATLCKVV